MKNQEVHAKSRKNDHPEARIVKEIYEHLNRLGFSIDWYESKATYNEASGRYMSSQMRVGHSDLAGNDPDGIAVYIEVKNTGRRSTLRENQRSFLMDKIKTNCFAIVADSLQYVLNTYNQWDICPLSERRKFLLSLLPKEKEDLADPFQGL